MKSEETIDRIICKRFEGELAMEIFEGDILEERS
jgi:hypothetical protein